jgi:hypothetical protein
VSLAQDEYGQFSMNEAPSATVPSGASWVALKVDEFDLAPMERKQIVLQVTVPAGQAPGAFPAAVVLDATEALPEGQTASSEMLSALLITVRGNVTPQIELKAIQMLPPATPGAGMAVGVAMANTGSTYAAVVNPTLSINTRPKAAVGTDPGVPVQVDQVTLSGEQPLLLPGTLRVMNFTLSAQLPPGDYTAVVRVGYGPATPATASYDFSVAKKATDPGATPPPAAPNADTP